MRVPLIVSLLLLPALAFSQSFNAARFAMPHSIAPTVDQFELFFAPALLTNMPFPNSGAKGTIGWSAEGVFASRIPGLWYPSISELLAAGYKMQGFSNANDDTGWVVQYFTITPGLSYQGIVNVGLSIMIPISAKATMYQAGDELATAKYAHASRLNVVLEPRLLVGIPIMMHYDHGLILLVGGGYPLTNTFADGYFISGLKLPDVSVGLSYIFHL
jgi:hypothetical protein